MKCTTISATVMSIALATISAMIPSMAEAADPATLNVKRSHSRTTDRFLLMGGTGLPDLLHLELDASVNRYLAVTARVSTIPLFPLFMGTASAGVLGTIPLSSDTSIVPRHAIGLSVEASAYYQTAPDSRDSFGPGEKPEPQVTEGITPLVSFAYLYTSDSGFHFRGVYGVMSSYFQGSFRSESTFRISFGTLF